MRLLFWASTFGHTIGGGPVLGPCLAGALRERGHDVLVLSDQRPASLPADECVGGVRVLRFPFRRALTRDPVLFASLKGRIAALKREFRPDLAYIFSSGYGELFHYATSDVQPGPHVVTLHDSFEEERLRRRTIVGHNVRSAAWVTTCSRCVLDHTRRHVPEITARSSAILNAIPVPDRAVAPFLDSARLLYAGRLVRKKGVDILIEAFARLAPTYPSLGLTIAGDGEARPELEALAARLGAVERIRFTGAMDRRDILDLMSGAGIVVVPSRIEPFGLVALEAAHMERPVIASNVDGLPEVVVDDRTGVLVPPEDAARLAEAVASLVDDPRRAQKLGQQARAHALESFDWKVFVGMYETLFERIAGR
jgi:glycosyltransferase involved in cell wall biosynthesis